MNREWEILLELARELKRVCEKHKIKYFLHAGTLLGAVRHSGFIPWDDDMDFSLLRSDFEKLKKVAKDEFKAPFYFQMDEELNGYTTYGLARLRYDGTTGVQRVAELYQTYHQGICIDIVPLDTLPNDEKKRLRIVRKIRRLVLMVGFKFQNRNRRYIEKLGCGLFETKLLKFINLFYSRKGIKSKLQNTVSKYQNNSGDCLIAVSEMLGANSGKIIPSDLYDTTVDLKFEKISFPAPEKYDDFLGMYYGSDYLKIPSEPEKKKHFPIMNLDIDYKDYLTHFWDVYKVHKNSTVIVFGAGEMFRHFYEHTSKKLRPAFLVDNNPKKWGQDYCGFKICSPEEISTVPKASQHIIICSIYYKQIEQQLLDMGITNYYFYVQNKGWL